jgi:hypothetical protein
MREKRKLRRIRGRRSEDGGRRRTQPLLDFDLASITT